MPSNDTLKNLLIAGAVFVLVMAVLQRLTPPPALPTDPDSATTMAPGAPEGAGPAREAGAADDQAGGGHLEVGGAREPVLLTLGSTFEGAGATPPKDLPYRMRLTLSSIGASIETATLVDHAATLKGEERYALMSPIEGDGGRVLRSLAVEKIRIDGEDVRLADEVWVAGPVEPYSAYGQKGQRVSFSVTVNADDEPVVKITRSFALPAQSYKEGRHDLWSTITIENVSSLPHRVLLSYRGAVGVPSGEGRIGGRMLDVGIRSEGGAILGDRSTDAEVSGAPGGRLSLFRYGPQMPHIRVAWAAVGNVYFTCTVAPVTADGRGIADYVNEIAAYDMDGRAETIDDVTLSFVTSSTEIKPSEAKVYQAAIYAGEKDAKAFRRESDYSTRKYYFQVTESFGFCTFTALVELMIWLLNGLFFIFRDFGLAIIVLVLIVRALLHPITKKGQVNMVRMQKQMGDFSPKMEEAKKKYGNDKAKLNQEMMKLYREHGINPAGQMLTCLPMVIQMPIWVALFLSLSNNILMRHQPAFFGLLWIDDLTAQDALYTFASPLTVPLFGWELPSFNFLPLLVALFMYIQQKTQPKPPPKPNMTDEQRMQQEMMQKMMPMMSIMMLLIFYKMPAGLNLYIMCSSLFGWIEQKHIRAHIKEREEHGTFDRKAVSSEHGQPPGQLTGQKKQRATGWLGKLQKAAEEAQKAQHTQRRSKKRNR